MIWFEKTTETTTAMQRVAQPLWRTSFTTSLKTAFLAQRRKDAKKKHALKNNGLESGDQVSMAR